MDCFGNTLIWDARARTVGVALWVLVYLTTVSKDTECLAYRVYGVAWGASCLHPSMFSPYSGSCLHLASHLKLHAPPSSQGCCYISLVLPVILNPDTQCRVCGDLTRRLCPPRLMGISTKQQASYWNVIS